MRKAEIINKSRLGRIGLCFRVITFLGLMPLFGGILNPAPCRADLVDLFEFTSLLPDRDVSQSNDRPVVWKKIWDEARYLTRTGDFPGAEKKYEELFALKDNLELARWEYGRLLIKTRNWPKAAATMELLVEKDPERVAYLNGLGLSLRKSGQFGRALDLFKKAHDNDSTNLTALAGLAQGLVEVGRKKEAFPLFTEILARRPQDRSIHRALANLAFELGKLETARKLMMVLVRANDVDLDTLLMTARIYEELKQEEEASIYWQRCLEYDPDNREARGRLALYYENIGGSGKALPHLLALLADDPQNASLLSRICRIYIQADRFSDALPYFERYVSLQPDNLDGLMPIGKDQLDSGSDAISLYRRLLAITTDDLELLDGLANDLLRAGDPETALFMWEHVARLYPDRIDIYQEIVVLLERLGRDERLAEILEVLHRLAPGEIKVVSKLANLKVAQGDLPVGLEYYNKLEKAGYERADLFEGRGRLYEDLGKTALALADYTKLLALQTNRHDIRRRCIALAGKLGKNGLLKKEVVLLDVVLEPANRDSDLLLVARAFADARDFDQAVLRYRRLIVSQTEAGDGQKKRAGRANASMRQAKLGLADLYLHEGLVFESEQILREMFLAGEGQGEVLERLFSLALIYNNHRGEDAGVWLERYNSLHGDSAGAILMHARLLAVVGDYEQAEKLLGRLLYGRVTADNSSSLAERQGEVVRQAGLLLAEILIKRDELAKAEHQCLAMLRSEQDRAVLVILQKIYDLDGEAEFSKNVFTQLINDADDTFKLLDLAGLFGKYGLISSQVAAARKVLLREPASLAAAFILAEGLVADGNSRGAIKLLERMAVVYPDNSSIIIKMARYYYLNGQYASALQHSDKFLERNPARYDAHLLKVQCVTAMGEDEFAEKMLKQLFPIRTEVIIGKSVAKAGITVTLPPARRTLWQLLTLSAEQKLSVPRELMSARHMSDNSTREKKELNFIAVPLYARYRWELEFRKIIAPG